MDRVTAHGRFALMEDTSFLTEQLGIYFPSVATALAEESGWLDDCETDDDLRAAAEQGEALVKSGVVEPQKIADAAKAVVIDVMKWGEQQGAEPCSSDS